MAFEQFLPDYFAECEQHLASMRRVLLEVDAGAALDGARLQELARALHTLKGLSGMVGLVPAERLAHGLEDALRAWRRSGALPAPALEALFTGTALMEACIAAKRDQTGSPAVEPFLEALAAEAATADAGDDDGADEPGAGEAPAASGSQRYRVEFRPSAELAARGVGVEAVRARLAELGVLRGARPRVAPTGGIVFEFDVDVPGTTSPDESWRADGMSWTMAQPEGAPEPAAATSPGGTFPGDGTAITQPALAQVLRVDVARVDELMRLVGEVVVSRARLADALGQLPGGRTGPAWDGVRDATTLLERQLRGLREGVMRIRLVPVGELFERMRFAVRELARESGKRVRLQVEGQQTEIDKMVVERMLEPLLHLVRNAVSHGLERPEERAARGKPEEGRLLLSASASGDRIAITVADDGAGIDRARVTAQAVERGLVAPGAELDSAELLEVLCEAGFSTRERADLAAGRGVGMAVVRATVQELGGEMTVASEPGSGTRFRIELPLTLMIVDALLVEVAGEVMAVPQPALREVFQLDGANGANGANAVTVTRVGENEVVAWRGGVLPLVRLRRLFGLAPAPTAAGAVLVVGSAAQPVGLVADRLRGLREIVVQPLADPLVVLRGIAGATELGDGHIGLVLDAAALVQAAREAADGDVAAAARRATPRETAQR